MTCNLCQGFKRVHPIVNGRVDYSRLVYCACQNDKAGLSVSGAVSSVDDLRRDHYTLIRKDPAYRQELWDIYHEVEHEPSNAGLYGIEPIKQASMPEWAPTPTNESASMTQVKSLLVDLQNRLNKHIDPKKPDSAF